MKLIEPTAEPRGPRPRGSAMSRDRLAREHAKAAAIENQRRQYLTMECGDYTTWEDIDVYAVWSPDSRKLFWCEKCCKWRSLERKVKSNDYPAEPLF